MCAWLWPSLNSNGNIAIHMTANYDAEVRHLEVDDELSFFRQARGVSVECGCFEVARRRPVNCQSFLGGDQREWK